MYNIFVKPSNSIIGDVNEAYNYEYLLSTLPNDEKYESYYIISPQTYFKDADGLYAMSEASKNITDDILEQIKDGKCLVVVDFSYEANGLYNTINALSTPSHTLDAYTPLCEYANTHNISKYIKFLSMTQDADAFVRNNFSMAGVNERTVQILNCPSIQMRYKQFSYDDYSELLNVPGPEANAVWLNRRIREHRVGLIAKCVDNNIDFDKLEFSFIGSKFEKYERIDHDIDVQSIIDNGYVNDNNAERVLDQFGKIVGLDTTKNTIDMDQWLATSDIGRIIEMHKIRSNSAYEIVSEFTFNDSGVHFSEKFTLPILSKKPFVISGDRGIIKELQNLGFKTFNNFWPEDYDDVYEYNNVGESRTEALADTIQYIENNFHTSANYTRDQYGNVVYSDEIAAIVEHNYNHFKEVHCPKLLRNWQDVLSKNPKASPLKGLHPVEATYLVTKDETWEDAVWYHHDTNHIFVPIWRNGNTFFHKICAEELGYRLVKKYDLKDYHTIPAYAFLRLPEKRITGQLWRAFKNSNITPTILQNTSDWATLDMHLIPQCEFLKDFNLVCSINIDTNEVNNKPNTAIDNTIALIIDKVRWNAINIRHELNSSSQDPEFVDYIRDMIEQPWFETKYKEYYNDDFDLIKEIK